tara:strand:- start:474 stop:920 length:447 start_codon:yes stop_codon:yes gene_type:complete
MISEDKSVGFICMANYCRSPVAKMLLKNKYGNSLKVDSAGIKPLISAGMDPRSLDYLNELGIPQKIHTPKKIDKSFIKSSNIIFAMDMTILMKLNTVFKNSRTKIKLFSFQHKNLNIMDPYNLSNEKYKKVMNDIKFVIDNLSLEEFL